VLRLRAHPFGAAGAKWLPQREGNR
jgi:hypothetical protein